MYIFDFKKINRYQFGAAKCMHIVETSYIHEHKIRAHHTTLDVLNSFTFTVWMERTSLGTILIIHPFL